MSYDYQTERPWIFTDEGQRQFLKIRDRVKELIETAGAVRMQEAALSGFTGSSWQLIACVDRMVELGEIKEISRPGCVGQDRVFTE